MNYFYDLLINLNDDEAFKFYEWNKNDNIIHLKKIPVFKITNKDLKIFLSYNIQVEQDFLNLIKNKTESYEQNSEPIMYMALFTDENNSILLEFNSQGKSIYRSSLLLEEELDLLEISYSLKKESLSYEKLEKLAVKDEIRQVREANRFLSLEINSLYEEENFSKLRYLYNEIFNEDSNNLEEIHTKLLDLIKSDFQESHLKLLKIIELSYKHLST